MAKKKVTKKKVTKKPTSKKSRKDSPKKIITEVKLDKALTQNFIDLQRVMIDQSVKVENLTNQISKLLELFENSAKTLAKKEFDSGKENRNTKALMGKVDELFQQNKIIAKGVSMIHEKEKEEQPMYSETMTQPPAQVQAYHQNKTVEEQNTYPKTNPNQKFNQLPKY